MYAEVMQLAAAASVATAAKRLQANLEISDFHYKNCHAVGIMLKI